MILLNTKRLLMWPLLALLLCWSDGASAAVPASWKESGFAINASGMTLRQVLNEFGLAYGVHVALSAPGDVVLKGRLQGANGSEFLERLALANRFRWFVYNDKLSIVPGDDNTSLRLEVGEDAVPDAKAALLGLGLLDSRFGWGEIPDEGVVVVSGPREYVNLVRGVLLPEGKKAPVQGKQVMVFRLKYASATDRVISTRGQQQTVPGIKTILSGLLTNDNQRVGRESEKFDLHGKNRSYQAKMGAGAATEVASSNGGEQGEVQRNGSGMNKAGRRPARDEDDEQDEDGKARNRPRNSAPRIDADPSLNAIIIYDTGSKREMYKNLIAELDIEPQQVEIEAVIVDIDRSKLAAMGAEWGFSLGAVSATINGSAGDSKGVETPIAGSTLLIRNAANFYARLNAMEGAGEAHVLAKPTVMTLENVAAVLDLSQTVYIPLTGERVADLADITAGTMLKVLPRIVREGDRVRVRLDVDIEDGSLSQSSARPNATRTTVTTQAIIDQQQTLMIGGYHSDSKSLDNKKIPFLGDIPVLGALFSNNSNSSSNRERLFLITPRLIGSAGLPAAARSAAAEQARRLVSASSEGGEAAKAKLAPVYGKDGGMRLQLSSGLNCGQSCGR
ncbi:type III secretion protein C [Collimonas sp. PA-H2]|uniref:type III secretion system outer membrane ring subunit SctC n=1 Tax=Collimonas sp. PA-H2 TaxID=1881062 RepID=UPI000BF7E46A|nr:type III secretion system outer membrane ring subunit SctC [Collimonas sp. PA-H2]PFH10301.1 type III secretion protein C [Collimonas sp. PA-H2]